MNAFVTGADRERIQTHLAPGEKLLWVGKPEVGLLSPPNIFCLFFCGILICVSLMAMQCETDDVIPRLIGSPGFIIFTAVILMGIILLSARCRHRWVYALTNKRALVLTHKKLRAYEIKPYMVLSSRVPEHGLGKLVFEIEKDDESRQEWGFLHCRGLSEPLQLLEEMLDGLALESAKSPELRRAEKEDTLIKLAQEPHILPKIIGFMIASLLFTGGSMFYYMQQGTWGGAKIFLLLGLFCGGVSFMTFVSCRHGRRLLRERDSDTP